MTRVIEYCLSNVDDERRDRLRHLDRTREYTCLEHCGICCREPFLVVDGTVVRDEDAKPLLAVRRERRGG